VVHLATLLDNKLSPGQTAKARAILKVRPPQTSAKIDDSLSAKKP